MTPRVSRTHSNKRTALHDKSEIPARQCGDLFKSNLQGLLLRTFRIPQTGVCGLFRSSLRKQSHERPRRNTRSSSEFRESGIVLRAKRRIQVVAVCRLDLNKSPHCRVGDSRVFGETLLRPFVCTTHSTKRTKYKVLSSR